MLLSTEGARLAVTYQYFSLPKAANQVKCG